MAKLRKSKAGQRLKLTGSTMGAGKGKETFPEKVRDRTLTGEEAEYGAQVTFVPSSIRLYAPPLPVERLQPHLEKDVGKYAGAYTDLEWTMYGIVLQEVVSKGTFITRVAVSCLNDALQQPRR
jgi:hypothetical protein